MDLDPLVISRVQFAFIVSFHILFPAFTIGLANWIVVLEAMWLATGREIYTQALDLLDQDLRDLLRQGGGVRHRDVPPVRHQLEPLVEGHGLRAGSADPVR